MSLPEPPPSHPGPTPLISMREMRKVFPGVVANDGVDLDVFPGEIHALLGENGAGKSTLMKMLYGFYRPDAGRIALHGRPLTIRSPHDARAAGIGMLFQDFTLIPAFTVAENIALFLPRLPAVVDLKAVRRRIEQLSARYSLKVEPGAAVSQLSIGEQQKVEILKLLLSDARLLILDEPTRVLAPHEVESLMQVLQSLRQDGYAIVLITHKLREVLDCADRITVLRSGRVAGALLRAEANEDKLLGLMFEKALSAVQAVEKAEALAQVPALELRGVWTRAEGAGTSLKDLHLSIYPGEIVGVAGVSGNGQKELGELILGVVAPERGSKLLFGEDATRESVRATRKRGVRFIPENPLLMACVPFMTVLENMALTRADRYARSGGLRLDWPAVREDFAQSSRALGYSLPMFAPAKSLSGGNLQRMVILREMMHGPRLILASYMTRGLDVQSTIAARQALLQARQGGAGVLLISEDLEELFALSDRLVVLYEGRIAGPFKPSETDVYRVGRMMTGSESPHVAKDG